MAGEPDHEFVLTVAAHLDLTQGELVAETHLTLFCDGYSECLWQIPVPPKPDVTGAHGLGVTLTPELLAELAASHEKYYTDSWTGAGWMWNAESQEMVPTALVPSSD